MANRESFTASSFARLDDGFNFLHVFVLSLCVMRFRKALAKRNAVLGPSVFSETDDPG